MRAAFCSVGSVAADGLIRVPKRDLVVTLVTLVETGRLKIAAGIPNSAELIDELPGFKHRINQRTRRETHEAGTGTVHDDIVIAVALACCYASQSTNHLPFRALST